MRQITRFLLIGLCFNLGSLVFTSISFAAPLVKVQARELITDFDRDGQYTSFVIKGVGYNPIPIGRHVSDWGYPNPNDPRPDNMFDDPAILDRDFQLLKNMNANAIRIWKGNNTFAGNRFPNFLTQQTFDKAEQYGIKIIAGFWLDNEGSGFCSPTGYQFNVQVDYTDPNVRSDILNRFGAYVQQFKDHPALLFWAIGNENNYHFSGDPVRMQAFYSLVDSMAQLAHSIEGPDYHPVALVHGDVLRLGDPNAGTTDAQMPNLDIWGVNIYRGGSFTDFFNVYSGLSSKPVWISEFGIDAWHTNDVTNPDNGYLDEQTQATYAAQLWDEIEANSNVAIGGTLMAYSDEWWKPNEWYCETDGNPATNAQICNSRQDRYGFGPKDTDCDGNIDFVPPFPDQMFNEEYFGVVSIAPNPVAFQPDIVSLRPVYTTLQAKFNGTTTPPPPPAGWIDITWTDTTNVTINNNTIIKTASSQWGNAGATSSTTIQTDGAARFTILETNTHRMFGLSQTNTDAHYNTIDYAIYVHGNNGYGVWEKGVNKWNLTGYQTGDVFTVERKATTITYLKNGTVFYTSTQPSSGSLIADAAIYHQNGTIGQAQIQGTTVANPIKPDAITDLTATPIDGGVTLNWTAPYDGGSPITRYIIRYGTVSSKKFDVLVRDDNVPGITITGLTNGTRYRFRVFARNAIGRSPRSNTVRATPKPVVGLTWADLTGISVNGSTLTKTAGNGWGNAGAASTNKMIGNGSVRFTAQETNSHRMIGLSNNNQNAHYNTIEYALYAHDGNGYGVWENGMNKYNMTGYSSGDVFTIQRTAGVIQYKKNGTTFYTSQTSTTANLMVDVAIYHQGGTLTNIIVQE